MSFAEFLDPEKLSAHLSAPFKKVNYFGNATPGSAVKKISPFDLRQSSMMTYADLINAESAIGRTIFGPIPAGHQREFCLHKKNVWVWHEGWFDKKGEPQGVTIRYEVRPDGVFKYYNGKYTKIKDSELNNFRTAVHTYYNLVKANLYF